MPTYHAPSRGNQQAKRIVMELEFPRRRILNTTFVTPGPGASKPVYRTSTTRDFLFFPGKTTIEFVAPDDPKDHRIVAQIIWKLPSQNRSHVHFGGHLYTLDEFLGPEGGFMNTDSHITFENETYMWRTFDFEPQLYDSAGGQVVTYKRDPAGLRKPNSTSPTGHLRISDSIALNPMARDAVFTSFFIFMVTRNVHLPWKKRQVMHVQEPDFKIVSENASEMKPKAACQNSGCCGEGVKSQDASAGKGSDSNVNTPLKNPA